MRQHDAISLGSLTKRSASSFLLVCAGWAVAAGLTGAYSSTKDRSVGKAARTAAKAWILAVPVRHSMQPAPTGVCM